MNSFTNTLQPFWTQRTRREQILLTVAGSLMGLAILYAGVLAPLYRVNAELAQQMPRLRAELRLVRNQSAEIQRLQRKGGGQKQNQGALVTRIEEFAAAHEVRDYLTELTPIPPDQAKIRIDDIPMADWSTWFSDMESEGIKVVSLQVTPQEKGRLLRVDAVLRHSGAQP